MAKRGATSELNDRNWDDEEEPEEAGHFVQADEETLQQRVIKKAKRREAGAGDGESKSAFSGFVGLTSGPKASGFGGLKSAFGTGSSGGGFGVFHAMKAPAAPAALSGGASTPAAGKTINGSTNNNSASKTGNGRTDSTPSPSKGSSAYFSFLKSLNQSVLAWIKQHVEENPYIILTPVFKDYEKYLEKHGANSTPPASSPLSSSASESKTESRDTDNAALPASAEVPKGGFGLSQSPFGLAGPISFGKKTEETSETEKPTASTESEDKSSKVAEGSKGFTFGATSSVTGGFTFGSSTDTSKTSTNSTTSSSLSSSGFTFGTSTSKSTTNPSSGFTFGTSAAGGAKSGFSFSSSSSTPATSGFSFGLASGQATSGISTGGASGNNADDEEYVPPKPEVKEIKEDDALYSKRCKLYYQRGDQWVDRGVGNLHLKPIEENKTQVLIRADTNLGNILLNVMLSASMPVSRQGKNNVFLVCVPNPPLDSTASDGDENAEQSKPVPMLVRVKTGEDADELFKKIEDRKAML